MDITIYSIAFNGYGKYISDWLDSILCQTIKPKEIVLVLGDNHETPKEIIKKLKDNKVKIIYRKDKASMGNLINEGIKRITTEWLLRVDIDDILLPNAIEEIKNKSNKYDCISLKFKRNGIVKSSPVIELDKIKDWRKNYRESGYVALKREFNNTIIYYEDNDFANFPYLFQAHSLGMMFGETDNPCVIYQKRDNSHSNVLRKPGDTQLAFNIIDESANNCFINKKEILLSIIVPVYNNAKNIKRCLDSIELRNDIEIIIIDDCSKDNSVTNINKWINNIGFKDITFIQNDKNFGVGHVVNQGYDLMRGKYVLTLCDDDYLYKDETNNIIKELDGTDLVFYNLEINNGKILDGTKLPGSSKIYKTSIIGDTRRIDQNFGGDKIFYQEILKKNPSKKDTGIKFYHYNYPREGSLMDKWKNGEKDIMDFNITVYTIVFNDYGRFLPQWIDNIKYQNMKASEIIIVLGKNHGANIKELKEQLKDIKYQIIECEDDVMGILRNKAIKKIKTEWMLYFSVDDMLLGNCIEEVYRKSSTCDAVYLKYVDKLLSGTEVVRGNILDRYNMFDWKNVCTVPGYIALKRKYNNKVLYYEEIEIPNYPYLFMLAQIGLRLGNTNEICAVYKRREGSHGYISSKNGAINDFARYIDERAEYYFNKLIDDDCLLDIIVMKDFNDLTLIDEEEDLIEQKKSGKLLRKKGSTIIGINSERYKTLSKKGLIKKVLKIYKT